MALMLTFMFLEGPQGPERLVSDSKTTDLKTASPPTNKQSERMTPPRCVWSPLEIFGAYGSLQKNGTPSTAEKGGG
jgi:hypothetical protein